MKKEKQPNTKSDKLNAIALQTEKERSKMTQATADALRLALINLHSVNKCYTIQSDVKNFLQQFNFLTVAVVGIGWLINLK